MPAPVDMRRVCVLLVVALGVACVVGTLMASQPQPHHAWSSQYAQAELLEANEWADFVQQTAASAQEDLEQAAAFVELDAEVEVAGELVSRLGLRSARGGPERKRWACCCFKWMAER